jgi:capsular exopolysaccharide synthesis family protein
VSDIVPFNPRGVPAQHDPSLTRTPFEGYPEVNVEGTGIKDYLAIVRRQLWLVLAVVAVCLAVTSYFVLRAPAQYMANAVVRLADARRTMTSNAEGSAYEQVLGRETDVLLSQVQVLQSRRIARDAVEAAGLRLIPAKGSDYPAEIEQVTIVEPATTDTLRLNFGPTGVTMATRSAKVTGSYGQPVTAGGVTLLVSKRPDDLEESKFTLVSETRAVDNLLGSFKAIPRPKTDIIDLRYTSPQPRYSQRIANAMATTFQANNTTGAQQASRRRRIFLEEQMKQTDAMLQSAMQQYSAYRTGNQVFSSKEKATAQQAGIVDLDMRRADLDAQRRTYRQLLQQTQRNGGDGLQALVASPGIAANPVIQQLYGQLTNYQGRRDSLNSAGAAETNPDVIAVNTLITRVNNGIIAAVRNQIQALDAQIAALDNLKVRSTAEIASAPRAETEETRLAQQVEAVQKMSDNLQEEHQKARMAEAVEAGQVQIVDLAELPSDPIPSGKTRKMALGLILGLIVGVGLGIVVDGMNTSIRRRDDLERVLNVPGLAVIPRFLPAESRGQRISRVLPGKSRNGTNGNRSAQRAQGLVTVHDARSSSAEAYRTLRTNLIFSQAVQTLRTLVVTSPAPSEGKTTTAANLAVSFAQQGMRVLLVDCDLRRSRIHKMFGIPREPGMSELILGQQDIDSVARETPVPGLYILPSGILPPNPSELLGGDRMRKTLASLSEAFDLIVIDTPPLLAASDAAILATITDGVVLVVRAGVTEVEAGQQAIAQLQSVGARVVGAVLNDPDSKLQQYGGYYNYDYSSV